MTPHQIIAELVTLKDMHDLIEADRTGQTINADSLLAMQQDYQRRKPVAWAAARAFLAEPKAQPDASVHIAWCRYVIKHERPTRIVLCDSDAEGAFPVFRRPHDRECTNDLYARSVCEGMWADKCDDVIALVDALRAVYSLAGESKDVKRIVHEAIAKHGGPEVA